MISFLGVVLEFLLYRVLRHILMGLGRVIKREKLR